MTELTLDKVYQIVRLIEPQAEHVMKTYASLVPNDETDDRDKVAYIVASCPGVHKLEPERVASLFRGAPTFSIPNRNILNAIRVTHPRVCKSTGKFTALRLWVPIQIKSNRDWCLAVAVSRLMDECGNSWNRYMTSDELASMLTQWCKEHKRDKEV